MELGGIEILPIARDTDASTRARHITNADFVFHLAGVNRPNDVAEFESGNVGVTKALCDDLAANGRAVPLVFASSTQAVLDNPYGRSKRAAEGVIREYAQATGAPVFILRLTNIFGKWSRPSYNSAVATFCHNVSCGLPIVVNDPDAPLRLLYIDDLVAAFVRLLDPAQRDSRLEPGPVYETTVGTVAATIRGFGRNRETATVADVGYGLVRALWATYLSFLPPGAFSYPLSVHRDARGVFAEMLKTTSSGQFSFFTARPGVTRGSHYHHTKTEKFLVVNGRARFRFRQLMTTNVHELFVDGSSPRIVETCPGWIHDVTNVGEEDLIVLLWANEIFDPANPDTVVQAVTA